MNSIVHAFPSHQKALVDEMNRAILDHLDNLCLLVREHGSKNELPHANEIEKTVEAMKVLLATSSPYSYEGKLIREGIRLSLDKLKIYINHFCNFYLDEKG